MSMVRAWYDASPVFFQNLMISAYGWRLKRQRYTDAFSTCVKRLNESERYSADALTALQANRLARMIEHAASHVPYYNELLRKKGAAPGDVRLETLSSIFPVVSKEMLRASPHAFRSSAFSCRSLSVINTSGTTGTPLAIIATKNAIQENYAFFTRFLRWAGVEPGQASATFAGRLILPKGQSRPPFWRKNRAMNNTLFSSYHISSDNLPYYVEELERVNPVFIDSYPSAIHTVARYILERKLRPAIRPVAIVTSSETLSVQQRQTIEAAFNCRVFDQYGSAEMAVFIGQCEKGSYHVNPEYGVVEVLDQSGRAVMPGEIGELICTGFLNLAMPLVRYRIGDSVVMASEQCKCGRNFPAVESILGRTDDVLVTPDGRQIGRLDPIFKGLGAIKEAQIIQDRIDHVTIKIVKGNDYTESVGAELVRQLKLRIGDAMGVTVEYADSIPRTSAGKFRAVLSAIAHRRPSI